MITGNTKISELYHSEDELSHHGVKGMKWGVRNDKKSAGSYTRRLNKLDQEYANNAGRYIKNDYKARKYADKINKHMETADPTAKNIKKFESMIKKAKQYESLSKMYNKKMSEIESEQWKTIGEAHESGYSVSNKTTVRGTKDFNSKLYASAFLGGPIGMLPVTAIASLSARKYKNDYDGQSPININGQKFKVKKDK